MASKAFHRLGNLLFYDGWHPDYVYFNTLLKIKNDEKYNHTQNSAYDIDSASAIAQIAIHDAQRMATFGTQDVHNSYFLKKLQAICVFLERAIKIERRSEMQYFKTLYADLKNKFPDSSELKILQDIYKTINTKSNGPFDYENFIIGINILKSGLNNAKAIFKYENDRIQKLTPTIDSIFDSREHQTESLLEYYGKPVEEAKKRAERSRARLKRKYTIEYASTGQLTRRTERGKGPYVLWGAGKIENSIPKAIDRVIAEWANTTITSIIHQREFLDEIVAKMQVNYPYNGNFNLLEREVQQRIILAIAAYGINNLQAVLEGTVSGELTQKIVEEITEEDNHFLDVSSELRIDGLEKNNFGLSITETKLFDDAKTATDLLKASGEKLYEALERTLKITEKKNNKTLLQEVLEKSSMTGKTSSMKDVDDIIDLINYVSKLKKEMDQYEEDFKKAHRKKVNKVIESQRQSKVDARIKFVINGGKVEVDAQSLAQLKEIVGGTSGFAALGFNVDGLNSQSLTSMLRTLKAQASRRLKTIISRAITDFMSSRSTRMTQSKLIGILSREMSKTTVHLNGPSLAELLPGLQLATRGSSYYFDWNNYKGKNDSVEIVINTGALANAVSNGIRASDEFNEKKLTSDLRKALAGPLAEARNDYLAAVQEQLNKTVTTATQDNHENKYSEIADEYLHVLKTNDEEHKAIKNARRRFKYAIKKWATEYADGNEQLESEVMDVLLGTIEDSIYVSNSTKSANDYWNEMGVKGGELGKIANGINLNLQLSRIQDIFTSAGMPIPENELQWITSAIINCFPGSVVAESNKFLIEQYLGSLIAFALFDEGGAEGQIVDNLYKKVQNDANRSLFGVNNMHLYLVDSIYYPGSFILQRTLDEIKGTIMNQLQQVDNITRKGAGILIINRASESMIGNRPIQTTENPSSDVWAATGKAVKESITIKILFLAGLMDIINSINGKISTL